MTLHVVLDTSYLLAGLWADTVGPDFGANPQNRSLYVSRANQLLSAVCNFGWTGIKLHIPRLCLAEALAVISKTAYREKDLETGRKVSEKLVSYVNDSMIDLQDFEPRHFDLFQEVLAPNFEGFGTEAAIGAGTADCLIIAASIHLLERLRSEDVILATSDERQHKLLEALSAKRAECPRSIDMKSADEKKLIEALSWWPLPQRKLTEKECLTKNQRKRLYSCFENVRHKYVELRLVRRKISVDRLPYTPQLEAVRIEYARRTGLLLSSRATFKEILTVRKNRKQYGL